MAVILAVHPSPGSEKQKKKNGKPPGLADFFFFALFTATGDTPKTLNVPIQFDVLKTFLSSPIFSISLRFFSAPSHPLFYFSFIGHGKLYLAKSSVFSTETFVPETFFFHSIPSKFLSNHERRPRTERTSLFRQLCFYCLISITVSILFIAKNAICHRNKLAHIYNS